MKRARNSERRGEGGLPLLIIVLALLAAGLWFLYSSRAEAQKKGRQFAEQVVQTMAVNYDVRFLNTHMSPQAQANYIPSWRDRMVGFLKGFGPMTKPIATKGDLTFTSVFFDPHGRYESELTYANQTAKMTLGISRGMNAWQVEEIELTWPPPPSPTPTPVIQASPSPTPTPTAAPEQNPQRRKRKGG
jgi:hypothetical protein